MVSVLGLRSVTVQPWAPLSSLAWLPSEAVVTALSSASAIGALPTIAAAAMAAAAKAALIFVFFKAFTPDWSKKQVAGPRQWDTHFMAS